MKKIEDTYNVSRETFDLLKIYEATLKEWQQKMNLVSKNSLEDAWERHFLDSMQLFDLLPPNAQKAMDLGSGAGFPGMVLAIMAKAKTPYLNFSLVESIKKKTLFLNEVRAKTGANATIINERAEKIKPDVMDVITSRAMASLKDLLQYSKPFCSKNTKCIFLKGKSYQEELSEAQKFWAFDLDVKPNRQNPEGVILIVSNIKRKGR